MSRASRTCGTSNKRLTFLSLELEEEKEDRTEEILKKIMAENLNLAKHVNLQIEESKCAGLNVCVPVKFMLKS